MRSENLRGVLPVQSRFQDGPNRRPNHDFGFILETKIHQTSIKKASKFYNKFRKTFFMDFEWIMDQFLELFLIKMTIKVEKGDFMKNL